MLYNFISYKIYLQNVPTEIPTSRAFTASPILINIVLSLIDYILYSLYIYFKGNNNITVHDKHSEFHPCESEFFGESGGMEQYTSISTSHLA